MKRFCHLFWLVFAFIPLAWAQVQAPAAFVIEYGHSRFFPRAGVTAAYAMDAGIVAASATPGGYTLTGKAPGETTVILVTLEGVRNIMVTVPMPERPSFGGAGGGFGDGTGTVEFGQYGLQYNNNPQQVTNEENVTQISGDRQIHVHFINANVFPSTDGAPVGFPLVTYEISRPGRSMTFMDKMVDNTDLTMNHIPLRGFHMQRGPWEFHAGITSITEFQDFILPGNRYEVAGLSRHFALSKRTALEGNFYYLQTDTSVNRMATPGGIATLYYQHVHSNRLRYSAEAGFGKGIAFSGKLDDETKTQKLHADFQYQSPGIASLAINDLHGRTANLSWFGIFHKRFQVNAYGNETDINLPTEKQNIDTATLNQVYWITHHLGAVAGLTASRYASQVPVAPSLSSEGYLGGPMLQWKHVGGSFEYQKLKNSGNTPGSTNFQINAQATAGHWNASAFFDKQTETPVFQPIQSGQADLRSFLQYQSVLAVTPMQMSHFLRETSALGTQGYMQPLTVGVASKREQYGTTLDWNSERVGHLSFNGLVNANSGGTVPSLRLVTGGVIWTRKLGFKNSINAGYSMFHTESQGQGSLRPVIQISLQRQLYSVPRWLVPGRRGTIEGHVFIDSTFSQHYSPGAPPLAGVLVFLDGRRSTHTDQNGYFVFHGVPYGTHRIEADYHDKRPFYFTSSSPKSVSTGGTADFGVCFAQGHIFGNFRTDTGLGVQASLSIDGSGVQREVQTDGDGTVEIDGLPDGTYTIHPMTSTLPPGYSLADLDDQSVQVKANQAGHFAFQITAQRSIAGKVELVDPVTGRTMPLANTRVTIDLEGKTSTTDSMGRYLFRHLTPGTWTVACDYQGRHFTRTVSIAPSPDTETGIDLTIPLTGLASNPDTSPAQPSSPGGVVEPSEFQNQNHSPRPRPKKK